MRTLLNILVKELLQLRRDPRILPILFIAPVIQLTILGYAATTDVRRVELAVCDLDRTAASRDLVRRFTGSSYFRLVASVDEQRDLDRWLDSGRARIALTIPAGFSADREAGRGADVQLVADGSDAMAGTLGLSYAQGVLEQVAESEGLRLPVELRPKVLYNPDLVSRNFMVPAVLAMILMIMTMMLTSMALVREIELGTMEQLLVTPLKPGAIIAGKLVPYALVGAVEILTAMPVVLLWFRVPLRGSLAVLALLTAPFMLCTLGLGLLVSTLSRTQQQAMMISTFVFMLPQIYLSGFVFPIQNMPRAFQAITYAVPLRYYVEVLRGVFLKGVGLEVLWRQGLVMLALGTVILALARIRFRQRLG
ncbi:MAG TPA: ABC transporter permease [Thermoanaerobaculales bacterium]|nr:ABC transporter permease [Thermoanaerobaculales bacterium]HQL28987.1 ABC transporter permease [Thermoanaerobaculales bacterium]HQN96247.1 ABC transporter permease [Thermoanaerobaculales bacterium]HQP42298.1 ABC transporter permease [Thermoanaerobaculales bacterium]